MYKVVSRHGLYEKQARLVNGHIKNHKLQVPLLRLLARVCILMVLLV